MKIVMRFRTNRWLFNRNRLTLYKVGIRVRFVNLWSRRRAETPKASRGNGEGLSSFPSRLGGLGERRGLSRRVRAKSRRRTILVLSKRVRTPLIALIVLFITLHGVECQRGLATRKLSVRLSLWLSVRLSFSRSVKCVICDKTTESCAHSLTADESSFTLVL